jgi:hypothetical protein
MGSSEWVRDSLQPGPRVVDEGFVTIRFRAQTGLLAALAAALAVACSQPETPEARVRALLAELEVAAEARDVAAMKERVAGD